MKRIILTGMAIAGMLGAADFWDTKEPSAWTDKEVQRLSTRSPWAKEVTPNMGQMMGPGMGGPGMGGPGGGGPGMGGPGGGGPGGGGPGMGGGGGSGMGRGGGMGGPGGRPGMSPPKITLRWESAAPMREVRLRAEAKENSEQIDELAKDYHVISVTGMRMMGGRRGPGGGGGRGAAAPEPDPARMEQMLERMREATSLTRKGGPAIRAERVVALAGPDGPVMLFLFPRAAGIQPADKEVTFESAMGPMEIKAKFPLKDMVYKGSLKL